MATTAPNIFDQLAQNETQKIAHDQSASQQNIFDTLAANEGSLQQHDQAKGPTISAEPSGEPDVSLISSDPLKQAGMKLTMPLVKGLIAAHDKLREVENLTQEGRTEHPILAKVGDVANQIEGLLTGSSGHGENIGTGKYGMLNNPVLAATTLPEAGEGVVNAVREGVSSLKAARAGGEAAEAAENAPGLVKQVIKGKDVAQQPAKTALTSAVETTGSEATPNIRAMMDKPIAQASKAERAAYDEVNKAAGTDLKDLYDYRSRLQDTLDNPANIDREDLLRDKLGDVESRIAHAESTATRNLVNAPQKIEEAKGLTQQRYAQEELKKRLFNNEGVISGNVQHGVEEQINVDAAIKEVEKLDKPSRFAPEGSPTRLEQALGKDGAVKLKQQLYDAQKAGESALNKQKLAKIIGKGAGLTLAGTGIGGAIIHHALGTNQ